MSASRTGMRRSAGRYLSMLVDKYLSMSVFRYLSMSSASYQSSLSSTKLHYKNKCLNLDPVSRANNQVRALTQRRHTLAFTLKHKMVKNHAVTLDENPGTCTSCRHACCRRSVRGSQ